jgi:hypothetical protein
MSNQRSRPEAVGLDEQILAEHQRVRALNHQLQASTDVAGLLTCLTELRSLLVQHFKLEEEPSGFFDTVRAQAPQHRAKVNHLQAEHAGLLRDLDALAARASRFAELLDDARNLGARLSSHEAAEDEVLMDTTFTDLGQGG